MACFRSFLALALCLFSTNLFAIAVDLSSWAAEGEGVWTVQPGNDSVLQSINGEPTVFFNGIESQGAQLSGEITVATRGDDDFIGFVLGYNAGDLHNEFADYLLIDWKQNNQVWSGLRSSRGLSVSKVNGALFGTNYAWDHSDVVTELQRGANLGDTGWEDGETYTFDLVFTDSLVEVFVDDVKELSLTGSFSDGSFGFYNYSQERVLYAGITEEVVVTPPPVSPVPVPASLPMFAAAIAGFALYRRKKLKV